jgi:opacity protein-like surface antigen
MLSWRILPRVSAALLCLGSCIWLKPAAADESGFYVGADGGYTLGSYRQRDLDDAIVAAYASNDLDLAIHHTSFSDHPAIESVNVGYLFAPYFGLEASYLNLGMLKYAERGTATSVLPGSDAQSADIHLSSRGPALAALGRLPLTDVWSLELRLGAYEGKAATHLWTALGKTPSSGSLSETSTSLLAAAGFSYLIGAHWTVRLDYLYLNKLDEKLFETPFNVSAVTAGFAYVF